MDTRLEVRRAKSAIDRGTDEWHPQERMQPEHQYKELENGGATDGPTGWLPVRQRDRMNFCLKCPDK